MRPLLRRLFSTAPRPTQAPALTAFPRRVDETARATAAAHAQFPSAGERRWQRSVAFGAAAGVTLLCVGAAAALRLDAEKEKQEKENKKHETLVVFARDAPLRDARVVADKQVAAVDARGDVRLHCLDNGAAAQTLVVANKDVCQLAVTRDAIVALTRSGRVLSIDRENLKHALSPDASVKPTSDHEILDSVVFDSTAERITAISAGDHHILALSKSGKVYSMSTSTTPDTTNKFCQLGLGEDATATTTVVKNKLYPVVGLPPLIKVTQIATGAAFNVVCAADGSVFTWGSNRYGQLATGNKGKDIAFSASPLKISFPKLDVSLVDGSDFYHRGAADSTTTTCAFIAAGGDSAFFVLDSIESTRVYSVGMGQWGQLGNGNFLHVTNTLIKVPALTGLTEYSEKLNKVVPIRIASITAGPTHAIAILHNPDPNFGRDVYVWGSNDKGQLCRADGKKGNSATPIWMAPIASSSVTQNEGGASQTELKEADSSLANLLWDAKGADRLQVDGPKTLKPSSSDAKTSWWWWWGGGVRVEQAFACGQGLTVLYTKLV